MCDIKEIYVVEKRRMDNRIITPQIRQRADLYGKTGLFTGAGTNQKIIRR